MLELTGPQVVLVVFAVVAEWYTRWSQKPLGSDPVWVRLPPTAPKYKFMIATDLKTGKIYQENGQPLQVIKYEHIKVSRGSANVKVRVRNLVTGQVLDKGYIASAKVEDADVQTKSMQYLYNDGSYVFMDPVTFEQSFISEEVLGDAVKFLIEGEKVIVQFFNDNPISVDLPASLVFEVTYTEPGYKGNTVTNVQKEATLNNGTTVKVPIFIKIGDKIKVDTRSGEYISKA